jgi:hypothetical protein
MFGFIRSYRSSNRVTTSLSPQRDNGFRFISYALRAQADTKGLASLVIPSIHQLHRSGNVDGHRWQADYKK